MVATDRGRRRWIGAALPSPLRALRAIVRRRDDWRGSRMPSSATSVRALDFIVHELRAPLTVMRGYLAMIEDGTYPVPQRTRDEAVSVVVAKAAELSRIIDVLQVAGRLADGQLPVQPSQFDVADAVETAVAEVAHRARLEWALIETNLFDSPVQVTADRSHVVRIVANLLHNALTYSSRPAASVR